MAKPLYPALYQINTRVFLADLSRSLGRPATLNDIPDAELDRVAGMGVDWVWLLSVWRTGPAAQRVSRANPEWRREFEETLPDLRKEDIAGSEFVIAGYTVHPGLGGDATLARLRERLRARGLRLMLDFVPNHMAPDHPWAEAHPDYFVSGTWEQLEREPQNYCRVELPGGPRVLAYGRDPYFSGWPDTLQLDYSNPATQEAMIGELTRIAGQCDGVRCDMAMLVLPDVFERTWGRRAPLFWPGATQRVRERVPGFCFMAEVYWDLEWTMLQQGFDYAHDKRLYDRLREGHARPVREHLYAGLDYQSRLARFLENHDEPRAAATFPPRQHEAAAIITSGAGPAILPSRSVRGAEEAYLPTPCPRPAGAGGHDAAAVLRRPPGGAPAADRSRRAVAVARMHLRLGRQRDVGRIRLLRLGGAGGPARPGRGELRADSGPVLRPAAVRRPSGADGAAPGSAEPRRL